MLISQMDALDGTKKTQNPKGQLAQESWVQNGLRKRCTDSGCVWPIRVKRGQTWTHCEAITALGYFSSCTVSGPQYDTGCCGRHRNQHFTSLLCSPRDMKPHQGFQGRWKSWCINRPRFQPSCSHRPLSQHRPVPAQAIEVPMLVMSKQCDKSSQHLTSLLCGSSALKTSLPCRQSQS